MPRIHLDSKQSDATCMQTRNVLLLFSGEKRLSSRIQNDESSSTELNGSNRPSTISTSNTIIVAMIIVALVPHIDLVQMTWTNGHWLWFSFYLSKLDYRYACMMEARKLLLFSIRSRDSHCATSIVLTRSIFIRKQLAISVICRKYNERRHQGDKNVHKVFLVL